MLIADVHHTFEQPGPRDQVVAAGQEEMPVRLHQFSVQATRLDLLLLAVVQTRFERPVHLH